MDTIGLNAGEKASLSQLARRLVERGARATVDGAGPNATTGGTDHFSEGGQLLRILELEKRIETIGRDWSKTLSAVLATVERLETRVSRLDGEVQGLHDREESREGSVKRHADELDLAATVFAETAAARLEAALDRVDALLTRRGPGPSDVETAQSAVTAQRG